MDYINEKISNIILNALEETFEHVLEYTETEAFKEGIKLIKSRHSHKGVEDIVHEFLMIFVMKTLEGLTEGLANEEHAYNALEHMNRKRPEFMNNLRNVLIRRIVTA